MKALLLIDIQLDFLPGGALPVPEGDQIIHLANSLQSRFDLVVATQDWHPANHKSFASNHPGSQTFETITWQGMEQVLWPDHCVQGKPGADFPTVLNLHRVEAIFRKGMDPEFDSYSGFFDNGHRKSTGLAHYLRGKEVRQLYILGLAGDYCVYFSVKDALQEGFETFLIDDGCRPIHSKGYKKAKTDMATRGANIILSSSLF